MHVVIRQEQVDEARILGDDFKKWAAKIILGVFFGSLVASCVSAPVFSAPGTWANAFRLDTVFVAVWGPLLYWAMARFPLWRSLRIYVVLSLFIEPFTETMMREQGAGYWDSVLWPSAVAYYGTIKEWAGVPGASLPVFFFVTVGLLYRATRAARADAQVTGYTRPPKFARNFMLVFLGTVFALAGWGILQGGGIEPAFRQTVHLMQWPIIGLVFLYAVRVPDDLAAIGTIYVVTALFRSLIVFYVYFGIRFWRGIGDRTDLAEWCTTHSDSVLFVVAILVVATQAFERPVKRNIRRALVVGGVLLLAMAANNRRLAFVSLGMAPAVIYLALRPSARKRRVTAAILAGVPLVVLYVVIGADIDSASPLLRPAKLVMSVLDQKDLSSLSRDVENENLVYTLRQNPLLPTGFGFNYQYSPNNPPVDLTGVFANFRLIAHNGVLWLWSIGGVLGFTALWLVFPTAGTTAIWAYRRAGTPLERSAALTALGAMVVCIVQIWGDQGINGYMTPVTFGVAFAVASKLAHRIQQDR